MHDFDNCETCQLNLLLYGEAFWDAKNETHPDVPGMVRKIGLPRPEMVEAFKRRHGLE